MKWNVPLTYTPKIQGVAAGTIRQTIRKRRKYSVGDYISFHGWEGKPRRSRWTNKTPYFCLTEVINIFIEHEGLRRDDGTLVRWNAPAMDRLASLDGIDPPTGEALGKVILGLNKIPRGESIEAQIIRWAPPARQEVL